MLHHEQPLPASDQYSVIIQRTGDEVARYPFTVRDQGACEGRDQPVRTPVVGYYFPESG